MPISFTDKFGVKKEFMKNVGAFDPIIDLDTKFFIDPALLDLCEEVEFINAHDKIKEYFSRIILLLSYSKDSKDKYWKKADMLLNFNEIIGTCLGYSNGGTLGNAIGKKLRYDILCTIKEFILAGEEAPELFELLGIFQERVGCDRISDLITFILYENILKYTHRIVSQLEIPNNDINVNGNKYKVIINPHNNQPILFLPKIVLSPLPIAKSFEDIEYVCFENQRIREEFNKYIEFDERKKITKSDIKGMIVKNEKLRDAILTAYKTIPRIANDFSKSKFGEYVWYEKSKEFVEKYPINLINFANAIDNVEDIVLTICNQFKKLIENNGLNKLLYDNKTPKYESAAQLLFLGIADSYCKANNIDLSPETNKGRGPVDFKLSCGNQKKVLVEVKLSSSNQLEHGLDKQLPVYMAQEETQRAIYLIIDTGHAQRVKNFEKKYNDLNNDIKRKIKLIIVDGTLKSSASRV